MSGGPFWRALQPHEIRTAVVLHTQEPRRICVIFLCTEEYVCVSLQENPHIFVCTLRPFRENWKT